MSGDITAINEWARSFAKRARAVAMNTGISVQEAKERLIREDGRPARSARANHEMAKREICRTGRCAK